jgi:hypothetical protein
VHTDDILNWNGPQPLRVVIPKITLSDRRQPRKIVDRDVATGPDTGVTQPSGLQPTGREQPVNQLTETALLQLTPPLRINPFRIGLDERHYRGISDHGCGCSTRPATEGRSDPAAARHAASGNLYCTPGL